MEDILQERRRSNDFRWASRSFTPSPYFVRGPMKSPKELIDAVLASEHVRRTIAELCRASGRAEEEVKKEAETIIIEMAHDFHMYAIRWFGLTLANLSKRLYNGIQLNTAKLAEIKDAYKSYPIILLPTHRSYVDFLLISFLSFHMDIALPVIAAGMDFMSMVAVGEMLRKSGAFYIRRKFGGDALYWAVVSEYVRKAALEGGHPLEMFIEGTRSRSGKSLSPKIGLLSAVLDLVSSGLIPDILILPIAISYDRTLEETLYAHELLGKAKPKESTNGLFRALRWLGSQSFGNVYVNFASPISFRSFLQRSRSRSSIAPESVFAAAVQDLALETILSHQKHLLVPLFAATSLILLSRTSRGSRQISFNQLLGSMEYLQYLLRSRGLSFGYPLKEDSLESNLKYILGVHCSLVVVQDGEVRVADGDETVLCMTFQHYANQCLPQLTPFCLISSLKQLINSEWSPENSEDYIYYRQVLGQDFLYNPGSETQELEQALAALEFLNKPKLSPEKLVELKHVHGILKRGLEPYFIAYWGMTKTLMDPSTAVFEVKQLLKLSQELIAAEMKNGLPKQYGALSLETLNNATMSLVGVHALEKVKMENAAVGLRVLDREVLSKVFSRLDRLVQAESVNWLETDTKPLPLLSKL